MKKTTVLKIIIIVLLFSIGGGWKDVKQGIVDAWCDTNSRSALNTNTQNGELKFEMSTVYASLLFNF